MLTRPPLTDFQLVVVWRLVALFFQDVPKWAFEKNWPRRSLGQAPRPKSNGKEWDRDRRYDRSKHFSRDQWGARPKFKLQKGQRREEWPLLWMRGDGKEEGVMRKPRPQDVTNQSRAQAYFSLEKVRSHPHMELCYYRFLTPYEGFWTQAKSNENAQANAHCIVVLVEHIVRPWSMLLLSLLDTFR